MPLLLLIPLIFLIFPIWVIIDRMRLAKRIERLEEMARAGALVGGPAAAANIPEPAPEITLQGALSPNGSQSKVAEYAEAARDWSQTGKDVEAQIGQKWLPILGIIAVIFGASFFLKYAFENNLIGETGRVMLGLLGGLVFLALGEYWKTKYERYAWILSGGGISLFYLSVFSAFAYYHLILQTGAFAFMIAVTFASAVLAIRYKARALAIVGVLGGFLTPFLLSTGTDNEIALFGYVALLNAGIMLVSTYRNWQALNLLGFTGTAITFAAWYASYYTGAKLHVTELFLTIFFCEHLLITILGSFKSERESGGGDLALLTLNAAWYFGWSYAILEPAYKSYLGAFAAAVAAVYLFLAYAALTAKSSDKKLGLFLGAISLVFLTLVFPIQFNGHWITIAWAIEASALCWLGFSVKSQKIRIAALIVLLIAIFRIFAFDSAAGDLAKYAPVFNKRFGAYLVAIGSMLFMQYFYRIGKEGLASEPVKGEDKMRGVIIAAWNVLAVAILSLEIMSYFDRQVLLLAGTQTYNYGRDFINTQYYQSSQSLLNQRNALISILWGLYATVLLVVGMSRRNKYVRFGGLVLFGITMAKVFLVDLSNLPTLYRFISFMVVGLLLLGGSYLYYRNKAHMSAPLTPPSI
jgi:uncharacterized membrane protein